MAADEDDEEDGSNTDEFEDEKEEGGGGGGDPMAAAAEEDAWSNADGGGEARDAVAVLPKPARLRGVATEAAEFPDAAPRLIESKENYIVYG
jgi:hypothetical protein